MGKQKKWTLEEKVKIVKEFKKGATISYLMKLEDIDILKKSYALLMEIRSQQHK